jgi:hypothetical protein
MAPVCSSSGEIGEILRELRLRVVFVLQRATLKRLFWPLFVVWP